MIIINASCRKSASTLIFDYQRDIVASVHQRNSLSAIKKYSKGKGYRGKLDFKTFLILLYLNYRFGDVVLKTHGEPTFYVKLLVNLGLAKVTYSYRDFRDVALSMIDHGRRTRMNMSTEETKSGITRNFSDVQNIQDAISKVSIEIENYYKWKSFKKALYIKYENFISHKFEYLKKLSEYLNYELEEDKLKQIYEKYENGNARNFNKGVAKRYIEELKQEEITLITKTLYQPLIDSGYEVKA